jgi:hypothetical protein
MDLDSLLNCPDEIFSEMVFYSRERNSIEMMSPFVDWKT